MNPSAAPARAAEHLAFLDGVRGVSALYVVITHCMIWGGWYLPMLPLPKLAVDVFIVISGYLMVYHWMSRDPGYRVTWPETKEFWIRRWFRIAPLYYIVLIAVFLLAERHAAGLARLQDANPALWQGTVYSTTAIPQNAANFLLHATFLFGFTPWGGTLLPDWSIGLEMQFYLALPLILIVMRRIGHFWTTVATGLIGVLAAKLIWQFFPEPSFLPLKLPLFVVGMLAAETVRLLREGRTERGVGCLALTVLLASRAGDVRGWPFYMVGLSLLLVACVSAPLLPRFAPAIAGINRALGNRVMRFLADTSYAVYLLHLMFISLTTLYVLDRPEAYSPAARTAILMLVTLVGSYTVGYALHRAVELPFITLGKRVARAGRARSSAAAPVGAAPEPSLPLVPGGGAV